MNAAAYAGRFAPSPTGPLHAGSLVAALASWLDARAHPRGRWLVRIEDVDTPRCVPGAGQTILAQLAACGLHSDATPWWQSQRSAAYAQALQQLRQRGLAYPCACSRKDIAAAQAALDHVAKRHTQLPYPGTCRAGLAPGQTAKAWRFNSTDFWSKQALEHASHALTAPYSIADNVLHWQDRRLGAQQQDVVQHVGDFVLRRADGLWAYQLAVVVDDAAQGITHVVRGEDLYEITALQVLLQRLLGLPTPIYHHHRLIRDDQGKRLAKRDDARALSRYRAEGATPADIRAMVGL